MDLLGSRCRAHRLSQLSLVLVFVCNILQRLLSDDSQHPLLSMRVVQDSDFQFGVKQYLVAAGAMVLIINLNAHYQGVTR